MTIVRATSADRASGGGGKRRDSSVDSGGRPRRSTHRLLGLAGLLLLLVGIAIAFPWDDDPGTAHLPLESGGRRQCRTAPVVVKRELRRALVATATTDHVEDVFTNDPRFEATVVVESALVRQRGRDVIGTWILIGAAENGRFKTDRTVAPIPISAAAAKLSKRHVKFAAGGYGFASWSDLSGVLLSQLCVADISRSSVTIVH